MGGTLVNYKCYISYSLSAYVSFNQSASQSLCSTNGVNLPNIHSISEQNAIQSQISFSSSPIWIGLHDWTQPMQLTWSDGSIVDYQRYGPGVSNNTNSGCFMSQGSLWYVSDCSRTYSPTVCEFVFDSSKVSTVSSISFSTNSVMWQSTFSPSLFSYSLFVNRYNSSSFLQMNITTISPSATITVNGQTATMQSSSSSSSFTTISININNVNTITVISTAQDGITTSTYTFTLNQYIVPSSSSDCVLRGGVMSGLKCFFPYNTGTTKFNQQTAQTFCSIGGGNLPILHSLQEQTTLSSLTITNIQLWIGLSNWTIPNNITWVDGSVIDYTNFNNGVMSVGCYYMNVFNDRWYSTSCSSTYSMFVCQYYINPGIFL